MIGYMLQRAAVRRTALSFAPASRLIAAPGITVAPLVVAMRGLRVSALASAPAAKASTKKKPVAKVATKKPAAAASAPKKQAANKKPTKSWELKDANGKPVPLPNASKPTRPSAYTIYVKEQFSKLSQSPEYQKEHKHKKGVDAVSIIAALGSNWKSLSDAEKQVYKDLEAKARVDYEKKLEEWQAGLTLVDIQRHNAWLTAQKKAGRKIHQARLRDPAKPRKADSPFFEFLQIRREELGNAGGQGSVTAFAKAMGQEWKAMSDKEKEPYKYKSEGAREQYEKDMATYKRELERR